MSFGVRIFCDQPPDGRTSKRKHPRRKMVNFFLGVFGPKTHQKSLFYFHFGAVSAGSSAIQPLEAMEISSSATPWKRVAIRVNQRSVVPLKALKITCYVIRCGEAEV